MPGCGIRISSGWQATARCERSWKQEPAWLRSFPLGRIRSLCSSLKEKNICCIDEGYGSRYDNHYYFYNVSDSCVECDPKDYIQLFIAASRQSLVQHLACHYDHLFCDPSDARQRGGCTHGGVNR